MVADANNVRQSEDAGTLTNLGAKFDEKFDKYGAALDYAYEVAGDAINDGWDAVCDVAHDAWNKGGEYKDIALNTTGNAWAAFTSGLKGVGDTLMTLGDAFSEGADKGVNERQGKIDG